MRILLCSYVFAPNIGGIETVSWVLAEQFTRMGSPVTVVTHTPGDAVSADFELIRQPSVSQLLALARRADIVFQSNISLRTLLPILVTGKPIVITHHGALCRVNGSIGWQDRLKHALLPACHNIAISKAVADRMPVKCDIVGDPFESDEFSYETSTQRVKDIVFLGRLVSAKGCDLALSALALLKAQGICPSLTVIGDGPELSALRRQSAELGIADQVEFLGAMREGRGGVLAQHKVMVIPSNWTEPFGVVALEGVAAGCVLAASSVGGLPEAVGPCGLLFPQGDVTAMAATLKKLLTDGSLRENLLAGREQHLERFQPQNAARQYLKIFESVLSN